MTTLHINGKTTTVQAEPDTPLLWVLRGELQMTGSKFGCGMALCGACTVHIDGVPTRSCVTPISALGECRVTTIEGLQGKAADAVRAAWLDVDVVQCGYYRSGQVMAAAALLTKNSKPSDADIDEAMKGNICRCGTYVRVRAAIKTAAAEMRGAKA